MDEKTNQLTYAVLACLFAALISIGAFIAVPVPGSPVPIVMQNMFIMLAALVLGPWWALLSTVIYLLFGLLGMPVFSGGSGGIAKLLGPTGGYLFGYIPAVILMGFISATGGKRTLTNVLACVMGMAVVYLFGVLRLKSVLQADWGRALTAGFYPFIPGDLIKIALASILAPRLSAGMDVLLNRDNDA